MAQKVFFEQIVPGLQHIAVNQHDGARDVAGLGEFCRRTHADIDHAGGRVLQRRRPGEDCARTRNCTGATTFTARLAFRPELRNREFFGVNRIGAGLFERRDRPLLATSSNVRRAGHAAADLIGQDTQIFCDGRVRLERLLHNSIVGLRQLHAALARSDSQRTNRESCKHGEPLYRDRRFQAGR